MLTRRRLLVGAAAGAMAAVGLVGIGLLPPARRAPRRPLLAFSEGAFAILAAVSDRLCPGASGLPSAWELEVPESLDALMDRAHPGVVDELSMALWLVENPLAGTALDLRASRFTVASPDEQDRSLDAWRTSRITARRQAFHAINGLVQATYWAHPRTWPHVGYAGPPRFEEAP
jgi:hypothetical protein